jgi:HD-like signal output (HDOD) protein
MSGIDRLFAGQDDRCGQQNPCMEQLASRPVASESPIPPSAAGGTELPAQDTAAPADAPALTPEELAAREAAEAEALARAAAEQEAAEREAQLQRLLTRMQQHADFPSLKDSIRGIQSVARSESAHLRALTDEVLGDVALSNKLLRMINTAFYSSVGGGNISSLQRAVALMGFQPVGMLANSLTLFERLPKGPNGERVRQVFSRALMAAMIANQLCPVRRLEESAYISAMFQNLGTMLAWMHFPPEATEVENLVKERGDEVDEASALQAASRQVLGMGYDDLALEVTRQWGWPEQLQGQLRPLEPVDPERAATKEEYLRVVCTAANRLAVELERTDGPEALEQCLQSFQQRYGVALSLNEVELPEMVERARAQWSDLALVLGIAKQQAAAAKAAAKPLPQGKQPPGKPATGQARDAGAPSADGSVRRPPSPPPPRRSDPAVASALSIALDHVSKHAMSEAPLNEVMQLVLNRLHAAMHTQRVVLCLRQAPGGELVGRLGVGDRAAKMLPHFHIPTQPPGDLFGILCSKDADTLISDTRDPLIAQRLPAWFQQRVQARCFLLLPLTIAGRPMGMIYADHDDAHGLVVNDAELTLLKALRNQLIMAMRLRGIS